MSLAVTPERSWYLPFGHLAPDGELAAGEPPRNLPPLSSPALAPLRALLADPRVPKAGHNVNYDWLVLRRHGVELAGVVYDSMLASFVLDPARRSHALAELARERLGIEMQTYVGLVGRGRGERPFAEVPVAVAARYCCADCEVVLRLRDGCQPEVEDHLLLRLLETIEVPLIPVLVGMEWHGVLVDREVLGQISRQFARELAELEQTIHRAAGTDFNINSTPQLRHILFDKLQLPVLKKTKTGASTDFEVLEQLAALGHEVPRLLIEYRELAKLKSTYVDALPGYVNPATGRIDPSRIRRGARMAAAHGRLLANRAAAARPPVRRSGLPARVRARGGHPPSDGRDHLRRLPGPGDARHAGAGQDHQLRHHLRPGSVRVVAPARHHPGGGDRVHRAVLQAVPGSARVARPHGGRGPRPGLCGDAVRPPALRSGAQGQELQHPRLRGAHGHQLAAARSRRRPHQARHDRDRPGPAGARPRHPHAAASAR